MICNDIPTFAVLQELLRNRSGPLHTKRDMAHGYPHGITPAEAAALDALIRTGSPSRAAKARGVRQETQYQQQHSAARRMGVGTTIAAAIVWDRWRRSQ